MRKALLLTAPLVLGGLLSGPGIASGASASAIEHSAAARDQRGERADSQDLVNDAVKVVHQMENNADVKHTLEQAKGVYIVPEFGKGAIGIGGRGGQGLVLVNRDGHWSDPAFYNMGGISAGIQAGASGGAIAMMLMTDKAVNTFKANNNFSLNADADLTIISYSAMGQASVGKGDVIVWSDTKGLFGGVAISITDINYDEDANAGYYGHKVAAQDIFSGKVHNDRAVALIEAMPGSAAGTAVGGTSGSTPQGTSSNESKHR